MITLYDLASGHGKRRFSPNCWRTRMALAHKGLDFTTQPVRFTEISTIGDGSFRTVPVIADGDHFVGDSWAIANYLESTYPDQPSLFGGTGGQALALFAHNWVTGVMQAGIINLIVLDIYRQLDSADDDYFRRSREKRFGRTLEEVQDGREQRLAAFRESLAPLRQTLAGQRWLGGGAPAYADYLPFGALQWARVVSHFELLAADDPVAQWFERMLDLHGGMGRRQQTV